MAHHPEDSLAGFDLRVDSNMLLLVVRRSICLATKRNYCHSCKNESHIALKSNVFILCGNDC